MTAVVVTWNSAATIEPCLRSLDGAARRVDLDVVVVDNGSTDGTAERVRSVRPGTTIIENDRNQGLASANNQGMRVARGDAILIANPDIEAGPAAVDLLADLLDRRPGAGVAGPRMSHPDGSLHVSVGDLPTLFEALTGRQAGRARKAERGWWWEGWAHAEERPVGHVHEACMLVRRTAIDEVGLQDERYPLDWEGIDWACRFADAGWSTWFTPAAAVRHVGGASIRQAQRRWVVASHRGMYRYFADRRPALVRPLLGLCIAGRAAAKLVLVSLGPAAYDRGQRPAGPASP